MRVGISSSRSHLMERGLDCEERSSPRETANDSIKEG